MREFIPPATRFAALPDRLPMKRGGVLHGARIGYETVGRLNQAHDNVILILAGLSADAHIASHVEDPAPGWWEGMVGPGKPIDTDRWYVVCVNSLGSCKGSTGPASPHSSRPGAYGLEFPELSIEDIADAAASAVRALGFDSLACIIGVSMGGMSALSLLARHADLARSHINISGAVHSLPYSTAVRSLQREAIRSDPKWDLGRYRDGADHYPIHGMLLARKLGMTTYRSAQDWEERFGRARLAAAHLPDDDPFGPEFAVEEYLQVHAERFAGRFDPNSYLYLSRCIDLFDLGESCETTPRLALSRMQLDAALVIGAQSDTLFPPRQQRQIADGLEAGGAAVEFLSLDSPAGHDAFLVDPGRFGPPVAKFLSAGW
jgi:homoserine O-acetyltransferase/serine/homoserine O-acetyltransferase